MRHDYLWANVAVSIMPPLPSQTDLSKGSNAQILSQNELANLYWCSIHDGGVQLYEEICKRK